MSDDLNPYASPALIPHDRPPQPVDPLGPLRAPSLGLMLSSGLITLGGSCFILIELLESIVNGFPMSWRNAEDLFAVPMFLAAIPIFIGAWNMRRGLRYRWAFAAAVLASTPLLTPLFCWGLPLGIWALVVLRRKEIKAVFAARALSATSATPTIH